MATDDLGIEIDPEVEAVLKDPKSTVLSKTVNYLMQRKQVEEGIAREKAEKENAPKKLFDIF